MCGIAGFCGNFDQQWLRRANKIQNHRGPDDSGIYVDAKCGVGLGHVRLSILDLSPLGHQPMIDDSGQVTIVYNGEIYNYRELRQELVQAGFKFRGQADTEVLLNLYLRDGEKMLSLLNGIFAFAIWDGRRKEMLLARDGLGIKPFYYAQTHDGVIFASEMKALLENASVDRDIDVDALRHHLTYLWCPAPRTILASIRKLEPGWALRIGDGRILKSWQYYQLPVQAPCERWAEKDALDALRNTLQTSVEKQMVADVPVGAFLSGGLDSSAVVAYARNLASNGRLQCFTIDLNSQDMQSEGMVNDLPYAKAVAQHLGVDLHTINVGSDMIQKLPHMIYHLDEPQADPAPLNVLFISQLARQHGIKVLLSGAGGDDIFSGYRRHRALLLERYWSWLPRPLRALFACGARNLPASPASLRRLSKAFYYANLDGDARIVSYFYWLESQRVDGLLSADLQAIPRQTDPLVAAIQNLPQDMPGLNKMLNLECRYFLADHNLNYTDKMSMATGVEVRVPLLDPDLVALASRLPVSFKQRGSEGKWIFKKAMEGMLPRHVIYRPKTGFGAPLRAWLNGPLQDQVSDLLSRRSVKQRGWFDPVAVTKLVEDNKQRRIDASYSVFALLCLEIWARIFLDKKR